VTPLEEARAIAQAARRSQWANIAHARHDDFHTLGIREIDAAMQWLAKQPEATS
ncbi:MAG: hypothetical protein RL591_2086, partial [Planctomycetota bacterium]